MKVAGTFLSAALFAALSACSAVERRTDLTVSTGTPRVAGPGDTVMEFAMTKPLPNAFGSADIFGRRTNAGQVNVRYVGVQGGRAIFVRTDVIRETTATTMTETPLILPNRTTTQINGDIGGVPVNGTTTSTSYSVIGPRPSQSYQYVQGPITLSAGAGTSITVEGRSLSVLAIEGDTIRYVVQ